MMTGCDLLEKPLWGSEELGRPIPGSPHAVSVALPRWRDVVGYEEKNPEVMTRLSSGYPRFVVHPLVQELGRELAGGHSCLPFPSRKAAELAAEFVRRTSNAAAEIVAPNGCFGVLSDGSGTAALRAFWQHAGLIVSSRQAEAYLAGRRDHSASEEARAGLRRQLTGFYDCKETDVFLAPTGMAAVYASLRAVCERTPNRPTAQLGFPYVDTLKLQQNWARVEFCCTTLGRLKASLEAC